MRRLIDRSIPLARAACTLVAWRQDVITSSGEGDMEPTGKGHLSRGVHSGDRVSLFLPLADE